MAIPVAPPAAARAFQMPDGIVFPAEHGREIDASSAFLQTQCGLSHSLRSRFKANMKGFALQANALGTTARRTFHKGFDAFTGGSLYFLEVGFQSVILPGTLKTQACHAP